MTPSDYEEFANIILAARAAFQITPEGNAQFKDWLQSIRRYVAIANGTHPRACNSSNSDLSLDFRSKSCKKELWAQINTALQSNSK